MKSTGQLTSTVFVITLMITHTIGWKVKCNPEECQEKGFKPCCGVNFECVAQGRDCAYNNTVDFGEKDFCFNQYDSCYFCCFEGKCRIKESCTRHFEKNLNNSYFVFFGVALNLFTAVGVYVLYWANNSLRLLRTKTLNLRVRNNMNNMSSTTSFTSTKRRSYIDSRVSFSRK